MTGIAKVFGGFVVSKQLETDFSDSFYGGFGTKEYTTDGWLWPNLAALLNAREPMRYGGPDPSKVDAPYWSEGVDNDFAGVTVQRQGASGPPLVSADWVNNNGVTGLESISHSARIDGKFKPWTGQCPPDPIEIWFTYCDVQGGATQAELLKAGWPLEFAGTDLAYIKITWHKKSRTSWEPKFENPNDAPPASPMQFGWAQWKIEGAQPRYIERVNP